MPILYALPVRFGANPQFPFISCGRVIVIMELGCDDLDEMQLRQVARKGPSMR